MRFLSIVLLTLIVFSCTNENGKPDVSKISVSVKIDRFDNDFFSMDTINLQSSLKHLYQKYPAFLPRYFEFFSPVNFIIQHQDKPYQSAVLEYYRNIRPLYDSVYQKFPDVSFIQKDLEKDLRYVNYYYPSFKTPAVLTSVESLNPENAQEIYGTLYFNDTLVISLQMFLGKDFSVYDPTQYFDYLRRRFEPPFIVPNSIRSIAYAIYPDSSQSATFIEQMIERGKQWFLMEKFLPDTHDSLITGFTKRQLQWCKENEGNIWGFITKNTDLFTTDVEIIQNYLGEAPFTQGMPEVSPGNIGQWIGLQIVKKFAGRKPGLTVQNVLGTPAKVLFQESEYKPK